jgi:hypothetical protein
MPHNPYPFPSIIRMMKSRRIKWVWYVARMETKKNAYGILAWKPEEKRPLRRPRRMSVDNIRIHLRDCLCSLVARVPDYTSRNPRFDSCRHQIFWEVVDLKRGPLSLVRISEELLEWKSSGSGSWKSKLTAVGIRCADYETPYIRKSWH